MKSIVSSSPYVSFLFLMFNLFPIFLLASTLLLYTQRNLALFSSFFFKIYGEWGRPPPPDANVFCPDANVYCLSFFWINRQFHYDQKLQGIFYSYQVFLVFGPN